MFSLISSEILIYYTGISYIIRLLCYLYPVLFSYIPFMYNKKITLDASNEPIKLANITSKYHPSYNVFFLIPRTLLRYLYVPIKIVYSLSCIVFQIIPNQYYMHFRNTFYITGHLTSKYPTKSDLRVFYLNILRKSFMLLLNINYNSVRSFLDIPPASSPRYFQVFFFF
jgi:hypothetical protein